MPEFSPYLLYLHDTPLLDRGVRLPARRPLTARPARPPRPRRPPCPPRLPAPRAPAGGSPPPAGPGPGADGPAAGTPPPPHFEPMQKAKQLTSFPVLLRPNACLLGTALDVRAACVRRPDRCGGRWVASLGASVVISAYSGAGRAARLRSWPGRREERQLANGRGAGPGRTGALRAAGARDAAHALATGGGVPRGRGLERHLGARQQCADHGQRGREREGVDTGGGRDRCSGEHAHLHRPHPGGHLRGHGHHRDVRGVQRP